MTLADAMLPAWVVIPLAGLTMMIIAIHVLSVQMSEMPHQRKRLRIASGLIMMILSALIAYALGIAQVVDDPKAQPGPARAFVVIWTLIVGLLSIVVMLALVDAYITTRHGLIAHRRIKAGLRAAGRAESSTSSGTSDPGDTPRV